MIQNENVAPVNPAPATQIGLSNVVLPTLNGKPDHDQTEIRHALLDMNKTIQSVQNNIPVASSGSLSSGTPLQPLTSTLSGNFTYSAPSTSGFYSVYIPVSYLVASSGGPYTLTIQSGSTPGSTVKVPISAFGNTIASGNLLFDIYVDSNSNVTAKDFQISGSNTNGTYVQQADGTMICMFTNSVASTITGGPSGGLYYTTPSVTLTFPVPFIAVPVVSPSVKRGASTALTFGEVDMGTTINTVPMVVLSTSNAGSAYLAYVAFGRWM
jgi:hypothetical protein